MITVLDRVWAASNGESEAEDPTRCRQAQAGWVRKGNSEENRRILIIDDHQSIHADFQKVLASPDGTEQALALADAGLFGSAEQTRGLAPFELASAYQGQEGLELVQQALRAGQPFAVAFVDMRMPPGWDGVETTKKLWEQDPDLQVVICTAHSDYSLGELVSSLGYSERLLILKKPFDNIEVQQLANALTEKWRLTHEVRAHVHNLETVVRERTAELSQANQRLAVESQRAAELASAALAGSRAKSEFLATMNHEIRKDRGRKTLVGNRRFQTE